MPQLQGRSDTLLKLIQWKLILALKVGGIILLGCQSGQTLELPKDSQASQARKNSQSGESESHTAATSNHLDDEEDQRVTPPTQIAGAFLTAQCEQIDHKRTSLPVSIPEDDGIFGCNILDEDHKIYDKRLNISAFEVLPEGKSLAIKGQPIASTTRQWQKIFKVSKLRDQKVSFFFLKGDTDGMPISIYRPFVKQEENSDCFEDETKENMVSSIMDFRSSKNHLALGQNPVRLFQGALWESGDRIHLEKTSGKSITRTIEQSLGSNSQYNFECPLGWVLTLTDEKGTILEEFDLNKFRSIPIKRHDLSIWIGYKEKTLGGYARNEGGNLAIQVATSTQGCKFKFVRERRSCLSR